MGKSAPTPPPAPDPTVVAGAQTASNQATAQYQSELNNGNSYSPYGSVTNTYNPSANQWTQNTTLSPAEQSIFNQGTQAQGTALGIANNQLGNVAQALDSPLNTPQLASSFNQGQAVQGQVGPSNFNQAVGQTVGANFAGGYGLLAPQLAQQSEGNTAQLAAQGLNPNDAAYQNSQQLLGNQQAQELAQLATGAVNSGNAEQQALFGEQLGQGTFANTAAAQQYAQNQGAASFGNTAAQQGFQNQAYAQQTPINEFDALMSSGQVQAPQAASLSQTGVSPTDVLGAYGLQQQALQSNYKAQLQNYQSGLGGLFNLGSSIIGGIGSAGGIGAFFA